MQPSYHSTEKKLSVVSYAYRLDKENMFVNKLILGESANLNKLYAVNKILFF